MVAFVVYNYDWVEGPEPAPCRLEIIMPVFFPIILFFNSHTLLLLFLHFSAIILKLCSKKYKFSNTYTRE